LGISLPALAGDLMGFEPTSLAQHRPHRAESLMALVEPLYGKHPESGEGRATLRVDMRRSDDGRYIVDIEMGGLLDDAIDGRSYRAVIVRTQGNWELQALGQRWRCARGLLGTTNAWTTRRCS
jgi:hypothetical protein